MTKTLSNLVSRFGKKKMNIGIGTITILLFVIFCVALYFAIMNHIALDNYTTITM
ncbi:hypothetical protein [Latilactobacillus curvatus]|uniref:hypothetical protein n=1 Tax=Latilactobacillus curvatus TaxID=28038 RepID=UPI0012FDCCD7|nr:hypothetical protein [Latilactobacillus curvatus]